MTGDIRIPAALYERLRGDTIAVAVLVELVARAAWEPGTRVIAGREVRLEVGDLVTSREAFADAVDLTPAQVRRAWERLEAAGAITVHASARGGERGTRVTVTHLTPGLRNSQRLTHDGPAVEPETGPRQTHDRANERCRVTMQDVNGFSGREESPDPRPDPQKAHERPTSRPKNDPRLTQGTASNVGDLSRSSDLGSQISGSPDPGSLDPCSSQLPDLRPTRDRVQGRDPRAEEQARLLRVIGAAHVAAHTRMRQELGFDDPARKGYVPAMRPFGMGNPAESTLRELLAGQVTFEGFEEQALHVLAVAAFEARREGSLRWFGAGLWSVGSFGRAVTMAVGEDRRPARASPQPGPSAQAWARVRELEALEAEQERAAQGG